MADDGTLTCTVIWSVGRRALAQLAAGGDELHLLRLDAAPEQRARVTVGVAARRIDFLGDTILGSDVSLIDDGATVTCLSAGGRERLTVERHHVPATGFGGPVSTVREPWLERAVLPDGRSGVAVAVDLEEGLTGTRYRHRLLVDPEQPSGPLERRLFEVLVGDADLHGSSGYPFEVVARLASEHGLLAGASLELLDEDGAPAGELGGFRIEQVERRDDAPDRFTVPAGFRDLRGSGGDLAPADAPVVWMESEPFTADLRLPLGDPYGGVDLAGNRPAPMLAPERERNGGREPNGGPDPKEPPDTPVGPPPPPTTTTAAFGLLLRQRLLDELSSDVNRILGPVAGASFGLAAGTGLTIDWLARARAGVLASRDSAGVPAAGLGTLLFSVAHDVQPPALARGYTGPTVAIAGWGTLAGRGLLDREAMRTAKAALTSGSLTPAMIARLTPATAASVAAAGTNWTALTPAARLELAFAVLLETTGALTVPMPPVLPFNASNLVVGELTGYTGALTLPPVAAGAPGVCPLITSLRCRPSGLDGALMLGGLTLTGTLNRRPGSTYYFALGSSVVIALFIPALWWVLPLIGAIGAFVLLDSATATLTMSSVSATFQIRFVFDASFVLRAQVGLGVTAGTTVSLSSNIPTGLHQVVDMVIAAIANSGRLLLDQVSTALGRSLTSTIERTFGRGFPAALFSLGVPILGSSVSGRDDDHLYLESRLAAPAGTSINAVSVRADTSALVRQDAIRLATATPARRHYISLVSSQNSLNVLLAAAFRRQGFDALFLDATSRTVLRSLAPSPYPSGAAVSTARLSCTAPPRLTLAQGAPTGTAQHGTLQLDMALALTSDPLHRFEWTFRLTTAVQLVAGSARGSAKPKIELLTAYQQPIDVLIDPIAAVADVTTVHSVEVTRRLVTEEIEDPRGKPKIITHWEEDENDITTALSGAGSAAATPMALAAIRLGLGWREARRAPRRDGVAANGTAAGAADPLTIQTYQFDGSDPDGADAQHPASTAAFALVDLGFGAGLLFQHLSLGGQAVEILDPANLALQTRDGAGLVLDAIGPPNLT